MDEAPTGLQYTHSSSDDHREFLNARLRALEVEHYGYALLVKSARTEQERKQWQTMLDGTEQSIRTFREGLESLA